jgi:hypothetical protein
MQSKEILTNLATTSNSKSSLGKVNKAKVRVSRAVALILGAPPGTPAGTMLPLPSLPLSFFLLKAFSSFPIKMNKIGSTIISGPATFTSLVRAAVPSLFRTDREDSEEMSQSIRISQVRSALGSTLSPVRVLQSLSRSMKTLTVFNVVNWARKFISVRQSNVVIRGIS